MGGDHNNLVGVMTRALGLRLLRPRDVDVARKGRGRKRACICALQWPDGFSVGMYKPLCPSLAAAT